MDLRLIKQQSPCKIWCAYFFDRHGTKFLQGMDDDGIGEPAFYWYYLLQYLLAFTHR